MECIGGVGEGEFVHRDAVCKVPGRVLLRRFVDRHCCIEIDCSRSSSSAIMTP